MTDQATDQTSGQVTLPLIERARTTPEDWALRSPSDGSSMSWAEVADAVLTLANAIRTMDLGVERRVLVSARNRPSALVAHAAAYLGEAASVPVNFNLTTSELQYIIEQAEPGLALVDSSTAATVRDAAGGSLPVVDLPDQGVTGPELERFIASLTDGAAIELRSDQPVRPNLLFTSGTTGRPKAVRLPPATIGTSADLAGFAVHLGKNRFATLGAHLVAGPLYHNGPLTAVRLLLNGVPVVVPARFEADVILAAIAESRVETSIMVPTHFVRLLSVPDEERARYDLSSLQLVAHTGSKCPVDVKRSIIEWWGPVLTEAYGGTESGTVAAINSEDWLAHPGSVGRAVPPFEALIVDEQGNALPANTEGRLYFRDTTGRGIVYEDDPGKTADAHLAPGVFTLGEIGYVDDDGFVFITDRFSDMVVSGGVNIYPAEAEQTLARHPAVTDVVCIGIPDEEMGERLIGLVETTSESGPNAEVSAAENSAAGPTTEIPTGEQLAAELLAWCRESLAGYKCPKELRFVDQIPRNQMGKIDKKALRNSLS